MPFSFCNMGSCSYAERNDKSYWLASTAPMPMAPTSGAQIQQHISRCVVCETRSPIFAMHSQDASSPLCPSGWRTLWRGYSFLMHTSGGDIGAGQALMSPGSCLKDFRTQPVIECQGERGTCSYFTMGFSFWLTHVDELGQSELDKSLEILKDEMQQRQHAGRCSVCMKQ
uniref:Collagen IV NC1 domain-containing protein n=2 Tax=Paramormyrops kingsleyae TaxID=1676925 RepID=A0A3B3S9G8_9TELE